MTSIEWFIKEIEKHDKDFSSFYGAEISQAKELEKEQIIDAATWGFLAETGEQYYKLKYKKD